MNTPLLGVRLLVERNIFGSLSGFLSSVSSLAEWQPSWKKPASCEFYLALMVWYEQSRNHQAHIERPQRHAGCPHRDCLCGYYAYTDIAAFKSAQGETYKPTVAVLVEAAGKYVLHKTGLRAAEMRVLAFLDSNTNYHKALAAAQLHVDEIPWWTANKMVETSRQQADLLTQAQPDY